MQLGVNRGIVKIPQIDQTRREGNFLWGLPSSNRLRRAIHRRLTHLEWILHDERVNPAGLDCFNQSRTEIESH